MSDRAPSSRTTATRQLLIDHVDATGRTRPARLRARSLLGGLVAFVLAGALTGGAVSAVAAVTAGGSGTARAESTAREIAGSHGTLLAAPFTAVGTRRASVRFGAAPVGATGLVIAIDCFSGADVTASVRRPGDVLSGPCRGVSGMELPVATGSPSLAVRTLAPARFAVWASWVKETPLPGRSAQQRAALADGRVTHEEYVAGFDRYAGCLTALGFPMGSGVVTDTPYIAYGVPEAAVTSGADARCLTAEFDGISAVWQTHADRVIDACLRARGVRVPEGGTQEDRLTLLAVQRLSFSRCEADHPAG